MAGQVTSTWAYFYSVCQSERISTNLFLPDPLHKNLFCCLDPINCRRESSIKGHLEDDLNDFFLRAANIQGGMDVCAELRRRSAQRRQGRDSGNFPGLEVESWPAVNIPKSEFDDVAAEIRRNFPQGSNKHFRSIPIDFLQFRQAALKSVRTVHPDSPLAPDPSLLGSLILEVPKRCARGDDHRAIPEGVFSCQFSPAERIFYTLIANFQIENMGSGIFACHTIGCGLCFFTLSASPHWGGIESRSQRD